jgi:hypothetical protein
MAHPIFLATLIFVTSAVPGQYLAEGRWEAIYVHGWPSLQVTEGFADVQIDGERVTAELGVGHDGDVLSFVGTVKRETISGTISQLHESHRADQMAGSVARIMGDGKCRVVLQITNGLHTLVLARSASECAI